MEILLIIVLVLFAAFFLQFFARNFYVLHTPDQQIFLTGTIPNPKPDGLYRGSVKGFQGSWKGKRFDAASDGGINLFGEQKEPRFPFKTVVTKGLKDRDLDVLRISYDDPANPWWVRIVTDEMVQTAPGRLLGKVHLRIIPGFPFTVAFFRLEQ
jgi:hypothetical protein